MIVAGGLTDADRRNGSTEQRWQLRCYRSSRGHAVHHLQAKTHGRGSRLREKMFHHFSLRREDYLAHYHKRSNVESTFSMIKAKFRDHVRSKTDVAMKNEVLCKIICHNICCLIQESHELGIDTAFWSQQSVTIQ